MSGFDSFFSKGAFKASKCKTLLKLTIPRIKLLRNRREVQIKQMRRDIAKLLETGQEATARIRVEHIIREEKMMAAQEIVELFCELIAVRLPIIESQRECPLDLKEAISSICFAAPRCADLPELQQVQMSFSTKYGKEFVAAATELRPECGVNRQLIELLSIRAPAPDVKLKVLKEIAEEYELEWDPTNSETELLKPHEDLLNGPSQFVSGSKLPLPTEKHEESQKSVSEHTPNEDIDSDTDFDPSDFPEVPKSSVGLVSAPEMLPFPASALSDLNLDSEKAPEADYELQHEVPFKTEEVSEKSFVKESGVVNNSVDMNKEKQFLPFISPHPVSSGQFSVEQRSPPSSSVSKSRSVVDADLQDVLAAARAAAESAERAAAASRSAASLIQVRINELAKMKTNDTSDVRNENPFHADTREADHVESSPSPQASDIPSFDDLKIENESPPSKTLSLGNETAHPPPQRLTSLEDETYFSYPNLFKSQNSGSFSHAPSFNDNPHSADHH